MVHQKQSTMLSTITRLISTLLEYKAFLTTKYSKATDNINTE